MKKSIYTSCIRMVISSFLGLTSFVEAGEKLPTKSMFCMALFNHSSQAIPAKQDENIHRWPIQTLKSAETFLKEKVYQTAVDMPEKRTLKERAFGLTTVSGIEKTYQETKLQSAVAYDTRQNGLSNTSDFLMNTTRPFKQLVTARTHLESNKPQTDRLVIGATEFRGREAILQFIDKVSDESKMWQDETKTDFTKMDSGFSATQKTLYTLSTTTTFTFGLFFTSLLMADKISVMDSALFVGNILGNILLFRQAMQDGLKNILQYTRALVSQNALNDLNDESSMGSKKEHNFLEEVSLILKNKSPWNPDLDFMHLADRLDVTPELAQVINFGASSEYTKKQIVQHATENHKTVFLPEHYWSLGYTLSFVYLPKNSSQSVIPESSTAALEVEPTLIVTTHLLKNNKKPRVPKKPKEKKKTAIEEAAEGDHALAPIRY